ncbi:MAG: hypothetical protein HY698_03105 [Deltaproteobacteria bacterium]|nr:hypothetical protein [Deltaproteobacteria bacterium]
MPTRTLSAVVVGVLLAACSGDVTVDVDNTRPGRDAGGSSDTRDASPPGDAQADAGRPGTPDAQDRPDASPPQAGKVDLWTWEYNVATDAAAQERFFEFAAKSGVRTAYLESEALLKEHDEHLAAFLRRAASQGMTIEFLVGAPSWAKTDEHDYVVSLAKLAATFTSRLDGPRPVALHLDVEPHGLPGWGQNKESLGNQYLDLLEKVKAALAGSGLALAVDVNAFYDRVMVPRKGRTRPLSEWIFDTVDRVAVMSYRDHAAPPDGILALAEAEIAQAAAAGKLAIVGVETGCEIGEDPPIITFCDEGRAVLERELDKIQEQLRGQPGFGGIAIHHYSSLVSLKP